MHQPRGFRQRNIDRFAKIVVLAQNFRCNYVRLRKAFKSHFNLKEHEDMDDNDSGALYYIVMNHEEQYSIWRADREVPKGWSVVGEKANKQQCLDHIKEVWTDMRPLSLRRQMGAATTH